MTFNHLHIIYVEEEDRVLIGNGVMDQTISKMHREEDDEIITVRHLKHHKLPEEMDVEECREYKKKKLDDEESSLYKDLQQAKRMNGLD